jgi:multicomponent Na+:H+ antiporter subunit C
MTLVVALTIAVLFGTGTWLLLDRSLTRIVLGVAVLGHGTVLLLVGTGRQGQVPVLTAGTDAATVADPLPQALALTAIVISFGVAMFLLALAVRSWRQTGDELVPDDLEDRRIAREGRT